MQITFQTAATVNIILMVVVMSLAIIMMDASSRFKRAIGDPEKTGMYKKRILWSIVLMAFLSLGAALFNLFWV